jgi:hypothetical protein
MIFKESPENSVPAEGLLISVRITAEPTEELAVGAKKVRARSINFGGAADVTELINAGVIPNVVVETHCVLVPVDQRSWPRVPVAFVES